MMYKNAIKVIDVVKGVLKETDPLKKLITKTPLKI